MYDDIYAIMCVCVCVCVCLCTQVGYKSVLHIHTAVEECEITKLISEFDPKTKEFKKAKFIKQGGVCMCRISVDKQICIEAFSVSVKSPCRHTHTHTDTNTHTYTCHSAAQASMLRHTRAPRDPYS